MRLNRQNKLNLRFGSVQTRWCEVVGERFRRFLNNEFTENFFYNLLDKQNTSINDADFIFMHDFVIVKLSDHNVIFNNNKIYIAIKLKHMNNMYGVSELEYIDGNYHGIIIKDEDILKKMNEILSPYIFVHRFSRTREESIKKEFDDILNNHYKNRLKLLNELVYIDEYFN